MAVPDSLDIRYCVQLNFFLSFFFSQGREDRTNHRIEEMIREMAPIPIRKASYKNLKALLEMEKEMEDQEELFKV